MTVSLGSKLATVFVFVCALLALLYSGLLNVEKTLRIEFVREPSRMGLGVGVSWNGLFANKPLLPQKRDGLQAQAIDWKADGLGEQTDGGQGSSALFDLKYCISIDKTENENIESASIVHRANRNWGIVRLQAVEPRLSPRDRVAITIVNGSEKVLRVDEPNRIAIWHDSGCVKMVGAFTVINTGGSLDEFSELSLERNLRLIDSAVDAACVRPCIVIESCLDDAPTPSVSSTGGAIIIGTNTLLRNAYREYAPLIWKSMWEPRTSRRPSLASLIAQFGVEYFVVHVCGTPHEANQYEDWALNEYYKYLGTLEHRPQPLRPISTTGWDRLIPGILAFHDQTNEPQSRQGELEAKLELARHIGSDQEEEYLHKWAVSNETIGRIIADGYVPGVDGETHSDCPAWMGDSITLLPAAAPSDEYGCSGIEVCVNSDQAGYLQTCGCVARQLGGVARRATIVRAAQAQDAIVVDCGNWMPEGLESELDAIQQQERKVFLDTFANMHCDAVAIGWRDFAYGAEDVYGTRGTRVPLVCANLYDSTGVLIVPPFRIVTRRGIRIAIIGWASLQVDNPVQRRALSIMAPRYLCEDLEILRGTVQEADKLADKIIVIGDLPHQLCRHIIDVIPRVDVIISPSRNNTLLSDFQLRPSVRATLERGSYRYKGSLVLDGSAGRNGCDEFWLDESLENIIGAKRTWLDESIQDNAQTRGMLNALTSLSDAAFSKSDTRTSIPYTGAQSCQPCHPQFYSDWRITSHSNAMKSLIKKRMERQPQCVRCHVTGFGDANGFADSSRRPELENVQCEVCHGSGAEHVRNPSPLNIRPAPTAEVCNRCHDADHSDQFTGRFEQAWRGVSHPSVRIPTSK